jgi:hypothetical protein
MADSGAKTFNNVTLIKSKIMRWASTVAGIANIMNTYTILVQQCLVRLDNHRNVDIRERLKDENITEEIGIEGYHISLRNHLDVIERDYLSQLTLLLTERTTELGETETAMEIPRTFWDS